MISDNVEIVKLGIDLLKKVQEGICNRAVIAGGWARDYSLDIPIRDIDMWLPIIPDKDLVEEVLQPDKINYVAGSKLSDPRLTGLYKTKIGDIEVDLISVNEDPDTFNGFTLCNKFAYGVQQAFFDGELIRFTEMFEEDHTNKTLSFNPCPATTNNIVRCKGAVLDKMKAKFPDYDLVDPLGHLSRVGNQTVSRTVLTVEY